ncbi:MAG: ASCH domain-containing protein [Clostridiales bacterium]|nr:ASCH domain-containing protein [Clostridiales bacterium]
MNLVNSAFRAIVTGKKTVEMRLNDEKRKKIKVGDTIEFENIDTHQKVACAVISLARYKDFFELYSHYDKTAIGYSEDEVADASDMYAYYSPELIEKYGALAIEVKVMF